MPGYGKGPEMKKHGKGPHMESAKQERKNLMDDNPVARTAAGNRPWIAKHYKSGMNYGSAMKMEHESPAKAAKPDFLDIDGDGDKKESMKKAAADKKKK
jgi:hypothetical protein